ncbi:MAG TPA: nucleoside recognition domain-containing protein, partial [bacterium]|nr:nucleoside recognition domain-containing protein [bacterium]
LVLHSSPETLVQVRAVCQERQGKSDEPLSYVINRVRMEVAESLTNQVQSQETVARSDLIAKFGRWTMDPYLGIPFFLAILYLIYEFVGKFGAGTLVNFLENTFFGGVVNPLAVQVVNKTVPFALLRDLIVGNYGLITVGLTYALAIVLPIVGTFFLTFGLLEDSGYLPRLAVMSDRVFRLMGLNGKAVLPMVLGLGCDTMATLTTRILESKKERLIATILLALAIPCSAQLGVILGMLATLSAGYVIIWALILVVVMLVVGYLASLILPGKSSDFLLEIPPLRVPQLSNILVKTVARIEWYLKEAVPLFLLGTLMLFGLDRAGLLQVVERLASPVISGILGLPSRATEAFIIGFLRRDYGAAGLFALSKDGLLDPTQTLVSLVTITLFIPCIANFFIIVKERGLRTALWVSAFIFPFAVLVGGSLNWALRTWGF